MNFDNYKKAVEFAYNQVLKHPDFKKTVREVAVNCAKSNLAEYNAWLQGDVHGLCCESYVFDEDREEWQQVENDSVWGYYGSEYALESLKKQFESFVKQAEEPGFIEQVKENNLSSGLKPV